MFGLGYNGIAERRHAVIASEQARQPSTPVYALSQRAVVAINNCVKSAPDAV